ncbi:phytanoyl-CoA dioxygenase family protein [Pedobacter panaciterrae]|uniref:Phytanoyl-CoA dioxygenase family protein n=1 Tax=Pedobacter panaciterrae TaxID=363849 RepID=A0ABU8NPU6_9SPHI|nr:phytanoyl-CoA dioxygenase family protein [uncultured Pedobacter sp.]
MLIPDNKLISDGYIILEKYLKDNECIQMITSLKKLGVFDYTHEASAGNLLCTSPELYNFAEQTARQLLGEGGMQLSPIKAFILDKSIENNWYIPWHQDLKIAVKQILQVEGYTNWTLEAGIPHTEPPLNILEGITTLRVHLDNCTKRNGAIYILPKTHNRGKLTSSQIEEAVTNETALCCEVQQGGVMIFKPLLLHNSPLSQQEMPRRILQIEYVKKELLSPLLEWH